LKLVIDIECNALVNPSHIWLVVTKDIDTGVYTYYRNVTRDKEEYERLRRDIIQVISSPSDILIGHNLCGYDWPVLCSHLQLDTEGILLHGLDTLVISKLVDYSRKRHSIEDYGIEFGVEKGKFNDFTKYSKEMEEYCVRDVDICERIYLKYKKYTSNPLHADSIKLEHHFQLVVNDLHNNGFAFNISKASNLLDKVTSELSTIDRDILEAFPPKLKLIREITPKETKYGTLNRTDFRWLGSDADLSIYNGGPFCRCSWDDFNPSSHKQIVQVLNTAGWKPVDKTQTHIETERSLSQLKYKKGTEVDLQKKELYSKLVELQKTGWKVNESNLETLPPRAPKAASLLARRILLEARRRTLTEWLDLVQPDGRIHGKFYAIGAWTHRMAHQNPNTANIPNEFDTAGKKKLLGKELRSLWCAPRNRLLVGCDAEGIQLRIFAHYINDPEFTDALVKGKKDDKSDPHSLNQRILGSVCKSRAAAKRFIYALLLGAGIGKLTEILGCTTAEATEALDRLLGRYVGWQTLKDEVFPKDAKRGWFTGLDGRKVRLPGDTEGSRRHLAMSGYLQNGEAVCMKLATLKWVKELPKYDAKLVNFVHDEWQVETPNNMTTALLIAELMAQSLKTVGEDLKLNCPLAGSYYNDDIKDYTIATSWAYTH
jgi:DNA polymerase-1